MGFTGLGLRELSRYTLHMVDVDEAHRIITLFNLTAYAPFLSTSGLASVGHYNTTGGRGHVNSPYSTDFGRYTGLGICLGQERSMAIRDSSLAFVNRVFGYLHKRFIGLN